MNNLLSVGLEIGTHICDHDFRQCVEGNSVAKEFKQLDTGLINFIEKQKIYFVATAPRNGDHINLSPKGLDSLRVVSQNQVARLNLTGSGNETAAHVLENGRMTLMFCSFDIKPLILRLYGKASVVHPRGANWQALYAHFTPSVGARQIFVLDVDLVQTSCGFAVPFFEFSGNRGTLTKWAEDRGEQGVKDYWTEKNQSSLDGLPTRILDSEP